MIDLHAHILPGAEDGAPDLDTALDMARVAVADGIMVVACTPRLMPDSDPARVANILAKVQQFQLQLIAADIPLHVVAGCEAYMRQDLVSALQAGRITTLNASRYVLVELPAMVAPPRLAEQMSGLLDEGYVPIITKPERLKWIETHFELFKDLVQDGVWLQLTASSLLGHFGGQATYWSEKLLDLGMIHLLASDAQNLVARPPQLAAAHEVACKRIGEAEAEHLVLTRPLNILEDQDADASPDVAGARQATWSPEWGWRSLRLVS